MKINIIAFFLIFACQEMLVIASSSSTSSYTGVRKETIKQNTLDILPQVVSTIIADYDLEGHENDLEEILSIIGNGSNYLFISKGFYSDSFIYDLNKHIANSSFSKSRNNSIFRTIQRVILKWLLLKRKEYSENENRFEQIFSGIEPLRRVIMRSGGDRFYEFSRVDFLNDPAIERLLKIECILQWDALFPILKEIYRDFYLKGHDCNYIIKKFFHGSLNNEPLLRFLIKVQDRFPLSSYLNSKDDSKMISETFSEEELNDKISSSSIMTVYGYELDEYELGLIMKNGHKVIIDKYISITFLMKTFKNLGLLTRRNMIRSLVLPSKNKKRRRNSSSGNNNDNKSEDYDDDSEDNWDREQFISILKKDYKNYDKYLWMEIESLLKISTD